MTVVYPDERVIDKIIEEELAKYPKDFPEWEIKAQIRNEVMDREYHFKREKMIYEAETDIYRMILERCTKKNRKYPDKCQPLLDIYMERRAYAASYYNDSRKPKLSPALEVDYSKMPYKKVTK